MGLRNIILWSLGIIVGLAYSIYDAFYNKNVFSTMFLMTLAILIVLTIFVGLLSAFKPTKKFMSKVEDFVQRIAESMKRI